MTKKEKEKKVLEALDLRVGDVIEEKIWKDELRIVEESDGYLLLSSNGTYKLPIIYLIIYDYEIVKYHQKTYGEYKCKELKCEKCPLRNFTCIASYVDTLYQILEKVKNNHPNLEDYPYIKSKLDKVVEDENEILN